MRSTSWAGEEWDFLRKFLPEALWDRESDYPPLRGEHPNPFLGLASGIDFWAAKHEASFIDVFPADAGQASVILPEGGLLGDEEGAAIKGLSSAARSDESFAKACWQHLGIDLQEIWANDNFAPPKDTAARSKMLAAFTADFGTDAFGMYLPFHAFFASQRTPWGIYLVPEKMMTMARLLHADGTFLPSPKPSITLVFRMLWWMTWRHELFHFHVERFATRQEICGLEPIYRPYVENYVPMVKGTANWLEEALAQAVVVESKMVKRALGLNSRFIENYLKPFLRTFRPGYRDFECATYESVAEAHICLAASILENQPGVTSMFTPLMEYRNTLSPPGYLVFSPTFQSRFRLTTPTVRETLRYCSKQGYQVDEKARGDHKRVFVQGIPVQLNKSRSRKEVDLASIKQMAKVEGVNTFDMIRKIREC